MTRLEDYYALLGLNPAADVEVIKVVYRALAKKYHPDIYQGDKAEAERIMKALNEAIRVLEDPELRKEYDKATCDQSGSWANKVISRINLITISFSKSASVVSADIFVSMNEL